MSFFTRTMKSFTIVPQMEWIFVTKVVSKPKWYSRCNISWSPFREIDTCTNFVKKWTSPSAKRRFEIIYVGKLGWRRLLQIRSLSKAYGGEKGFIFITNSYEYILGWWHTPILYCRRTYYWILTYVDIFLRFCFSYYHWKKNFWNCKHTWNYILRYKENQ